MDKNIIKEHLNNTFLSEAKQKKDGTPGISLASKMAKDNAKTNKAGVKAVADDMKDYEKGLTKKDPNEKEMAPNKFNYANDDEKEYHDEMEIMNGQEMIQYDRTDEKFNQRALEAIEGSSKMGNNPEWANVVEKGWGGDKDFGKNLAKKIKSSQKKRAEQTPTTKMFGDDWEVVKDKSHKAYAFENTENNKNKPQIKESMKRLKFKKEFNGVGNALKLIPEHYKIDNKTFEMTDGNESYRIRWEGSINEGSAVILMASDKTLVNEDIQKMKHLFNYKSENTLGSLKGKDRINENKSFDEIWAKTKKLMAEADDIEGTDAENGDLDDVVSHAPEAKKHVKNGSTSEKGTQAPAPKSGDLDDAVSHAPEAKKHVKGESTSEKGTQAPAPKTGHWEESKPSHAPEAKKHVKMG